MASRLKEDERNERIIRGLLKNPENKRCINCNSLGPQYVCTTFWTFICTNCSGIHREFTHRVKSVSMAKFTSQEVSALREGGNQRAKEIYFKGLDPQRQSLPDGSNVERLRDFIRHVYVNKRYMTEKNDDKPPVGKMLDKNDFPESQSPGGSRSPPYEDAYERRHGDRSSPGGRSPGFEPGSRKFGDYCRSPSHPEVVNDWRRDDRFGSGRKSEEGSQSPEQAKDLGSPNLPVVRPVREILGDSMAPIRVIEPPKPSGNRTVDVSVNAKRTTSLSSVASTNEKPPEVKLETAVSLIDFDADPEPPAAPAAAAQKPQSITPPPQTFVPPTGSANDNWASFDVAPPSENVSQAPSNGNTVDSLLSQLSVPSSAPVQTSKLSTGPGASVDIKAFPADPPVTVSNFGAGNYGAPVGSVSAVQTDGPLLHSAGQWPNLQQQQHPPSSLPAHVGPSASQNIVPPQNGPSSNQPWNMTLASSVQRSMSAPSLQPLYGVSHEVTSGAAETSEVKSTGRRELPADLFAVTYPSYHAPVSGWQSGPPHVMGYGMQQYNSTMLFQNFPRPPKSVNPFDFGNEQPQQTQTAAQFPSMASLQGALPNTLPPPGIMRTSSFGSAPPAWMPSQAMQHSSGIPSQMPGYTSPQRPSNIPHSTTGQIGSPYGNQNIDQHFDGQFLTRPPNPRSFPSGGNPFG